MTTWRRHLWRGCALAGAAVALLAGASAAEAASSPVGPSPRPVPGSVRVGALPPTAVLSLDVFLRPRDPATLERFATAVSTPGSPDFGHYLGPGEFGPRFGATPQTIAAVTKALRSAGLSPGPVSANDLSIPVRADAGTVARGLHTGFEVYRLHGGRDAYANTSGPQLPSTVAGSVAAIVGLNDVAQRRPRLLPATSPSPLTSPPAACPAATGVMPSHPGDAYLRIDQLATAYNATPLYSAGPAGYFGQGTTVAIYELEANIPSDIAPYETCFGIGAPVSYTRIDGGPAPLNVNKGDGLETELDIENVIGTAPQTRVNVYQGPNTNTGAIDVYQAMINDDRAQVISTSWGLCETQAATPDTSGLTGESTLFQQAATQGQTVFAAAGDSGSEDCTDPVTGNTVATKAVDDPASQPFVAGAGGTRLTVNGSNQRTAETVWNDGPSSSMSARGAGGGGSSNEWAMPSWQYTTLNDRGWLPASADGTTTCPMPLNTATNTYCREVPDVTADADPVSGYVVFYHGQWTHVGGTSGAAPLWAGLTALADSCAQVQSRQPIGLLGPKVYGLADSTTSYPQVFTDITSGNNDYVDPTTHTLGYVAGTGFDRASGLGAPIAGGGTGVDDRLCSGATTDLAPTTRAVSPLSGGTAGGETVTITGANFTPGATVSFGGNAATGVQVLSFNELTATAPAGSAGSVPVTVTTAHGTSGPVTYNYVPPPPPTPSTTSTGTSAPAPAPATAAPVVPTTSTQTAPPPPASHPAAAARLVLSLRQSGLAILLGKVACPAGCTLSVRGYVTLPARAQPRSRSRRSQKQVQVAALQVNASAGSTRSLKLALNATGRALLRQRRQLVVTVVFRLVNQDGRVTTTTRRITLRAR